METLVQQADIPLQAETTSSISGIDINPHNGVHTIKRLSIIIPTYNEAKTIATVLDRLNSVKLINNIEKEVIIVNDCSKDNTAEVIQNYRPLHSQSTIKYLKYSEHAKNQGKGAAVHTGMALATGEYLLVQDADLEYDPGEYNTLLKPIINGYADVVYGSRFMGGNAHRILFFWHTLGNRFLTWRSNMFRNLNLADMGGRGLSGKLTANKHGTAIA